MSIAATERCKQHRRRILELSQRVQALHIGGAFSSTEIVDAIYYELKRPQDTFIMSKGHAGVLQYVVLESLGILTKEQVDGFCNGPLLGTHPDRGIPGVECSTGALGHGLGMAVGMAYAERLRVAQTKVCEGCGGRPSACAVLGHRPENDRPRWNEPGIIYVLLSDGECMEGSAWEAAMLAASLKLDNLVCFVDNNNMVSNERISERHSAFYPLVEKFDAFGWMAGTVDGHDNVEIWDAVQCLRAEPQIIICKTTKGKGVSFMENVPMWHYRSPNPQEYEQAMRELA